MGKPLIMLNSITYAIKAKDILFRNGIASYIERTPHPERAMGCGYSLYVPDRILEAQSVLTAAGIKIIKTDLGGKSK